MYRDDEVVADLQAMIVNNARDPEGRLLDIQAQHAGTFAGDQRIKAVAARYGVAALRSAAETRARNRAAAIDR